MCFFSQNLYKNILYDIINEHLNILVHENKIYIAEKAHFRPPDMSRGERFRSYKRHFAMVLLIKTTATNSLLIIFTAHI